MQQPWDVLQYVENGSFVADLAGGVLGLLAPQLGERILDIGCGDGALTAKIAAAGAKVIGIDSSPEMLTGAQCAGLDVRLVSAEDLPFTNEFDAVFSNAALHWMHDQDAVLAGVSRALKPGGRFVAEMGGHGNIAAIAVALRAVCLKQGMDADKLETNYFPTAATYKSLLERHGFRVEIIDLIPRPTPLPATGMEGWLQTFRRGVLNQFPAGQREGILHEVVDLLRPSLCDEDGNWTADYVRLRFKAVRIAT